MSHSAIAAAIVGVSGYSGMELVRILSRHPGFRVAWVCSDRWADSRLGDKIGLGGDCAELTVLTQSAAHERFADAQVVFLCTPPEASIELAPRVLAAGVRVVDLSGAFRLPAMAYPRWYGFEHGAPELLAQAVYSLPEATGNRDSVRGARLVSNPGCYPTVSSLPLVPLLRSGLIAPDGIVIDAKSGTTGAGRKATEAMSFSEVANDFRAYKILSHQHTPEIENILKLAGCGDIRVTFTAHLLPVARGILSTIYARLKAVPVGVDINAQLNETLRAFAADKPFVQVVSPDSVSLSAVVGTNRIIMGARADVERGVVVIVAAEDNLGKGAAGQAVQNANIMFGLSETTALDGLTNHAP
jgi:N-acetyl-gamma-glutamyl-phosphate reductase